MTANRPKLPDFLIIGAMKAATTTLFEHLSGHPDVFMSSVKEPQFFSRPEVRSRGLEWYSSLFDDASPHQILGEASTCYTRWPHYGDVPGRIAEVVPDIRLIYVLRHPADRAYSHYRHEMQRRFLRGQAVWTFSEAIDRDAEMLAASRYMDQIEQFLGRFQRSQLLILMTEDLLSDPTKTFGEVCSFLDLPPLGAFRSIHENKFGDTFAIRSMERRLTLFLGVPGIREFVSHLPRSLRHGARRWLTSEAVSRRAMVQRTRKLEKTLSPFDTDSRQRLLELYFEQNQRLRDTRRVR